MCWQADLILVDWDNSVHKRADRLTDKLFQRSINLRCAKSNQLAVAMLHGILESKCDTLSHDFEQIYNSPELAR